MNRLPWDWKKSLVKALIVGLAAVIATVTTELRDSSWAWGPPIAALLIFLYDRIKPHYAAP